MHAGNADQAVLPGQEGIWRGEAEAEFADIVRHVLDGDEFARGARRLDARLVVVAHRHLDLAIGERAGLATQMTIALLVAFLQARRLGIEALDLPLDKLEATIATRSHVAFIGHAKAGAQTGAQNRVVRRTVEGDFRVGNFDGRHGFARRGLGEGSRLAPTGQKVASALYPRRVEMTWAVSTTRGAKRASTSSDRR